MAHRDGQVYIDADYSAGDANRTKKLYKEENNNEVNELSKELSEMGCIVDAVKRPPNICVETCVYDSDNDKTPYEDEDAYSDEFEDDNSDDESIKMQQKPAEVKNQSPPVQSSMKLMKSQSSMSHHKPPASVSGRSATDFGSLSGASRRINMSFTNERLREIERHNHILLTKILSARNSKKSSIPPREQPARRLPPSAAVTRKTQQRQIDRENMILLKKIQRAKSSVPGVRR